MNEPHPSAPGGGVVVTFALPDESRPFVASVEGRGTGERRVRAPGLPTFVGARGDRVRAVVHTGVGDTPAGRERLQTVLGADGSLPPRYVISAGYAGGLQPGLAVGDLVLAENYSDTALAATARRLLADEPLHVGTLTSQSVLAEAAAAKSTLAAATAALAVDMETHGIADLCARAGVPLLSLRVISDAADQALPVPGHILFDAARQRPRYVALPAWLLAHPWQIAPFVGFVRGLGPARARLTRALQLLVAHL